MTLPRINHPIFTHELISTGKKIKFRPFTVKEEKILLVAQLSGETNQINDAIIQVINGCVIDTDFDGDKLPIFDVEYLFLNLRSKSVNNIVDMTIVDYEDKNKYSFEVNLDELQIIKDPKHTKNIKLTDELGLIMKYPNFKHTMSLLDKKKEIDPLIELISDCVEKVYEGEKLYVAGSEFTREEIIEFINDLPGPALKKIKSFFDTLPIVQYVIEYENSLGNQRRHVLRGLYDFFL